MVEEEKATTSTMEVTTTTNTTLPHTVGHGFDECRQVSAASDGRVERVDLVETSGLAASRRHRGTVWAVNDSGNETGIHALGLDGSDEGFFRAVDVQGAAVDAVDIEDMAIHDRTLYLADIGDNESRRDEGVTVYLLDEPTPDARRDGTAVVRERIELRYPDGPTDAEAFLVDPLTGDLIVLDKELSDNVTRIFVARPPFDPEVTELELAGTLDLTTFPSAAIDLIPSALLFPGAVTAADISEDGSLIAVRTYGTVWLFPRAISSDGGAQTVAEALAGEPCEGGATREGQGESLALLGPQNENGEGDSRQVRYVTIGEGERRPVNVMSVEPGS